MFPGAVGIEYGQTLGARMLPVQQGSQGLGATQIGDSRAVTHHPQALGGAGYFLCRRAREGPSLNGCQ